MCVCVGGQGEAGGDDAAKVVCRQVVKGLGMWILFCGWGGMDKGGLSTVEKGTGAVVSEASVHQLVGIDC